MRINVKKKGCISIMGALVGSRWGLFYPILDLLLFVMIMDFISGLLAAKRESMLHPNSKKYGWSSKRCITGIYKKIGYIFIVAVGISVDYMIFKIGAEVGFSMVTHTFFGLTVTVWLIINELISILENVGRMGTELPVFLQKNLSDLKKEIDE